MGNSSFPHRSLQIINLHIYIYTFYNRGSAYTIGLVRVVLSTETHLHDIRQVLRTLTIGICKNLGVGSPLGRRCASTISVLVSWHCFHVSSCYTFRAAQATALYFLWFCKTLIFPVFSNSVSLFLLGAHFLIFRLFTPPPCICAWYDTRTSKYMLREERKQKGLLRVACHMAYHMVPPTYLPYTYICSLSLPYIFCIFFPHATSCSHTCTLVFVTAVISINPMPSRISVCLRTLTLSSLSPFVCWSNGSFVTLMTSVYTPPVFGKKWTLLHRLEDIFWYLYWALTLEKSEPIST